MKQPYDKDTIEACAHWVDEHLSKERGEQMRAHFRPSPLKLLDELKTRLETAACWSASSRQQLLQMLDELRMSLRPRTSPAAETAMCRREQGLSIVDPYDNKAMDDFVMEQLKLCPMGRQELVGALRLRMPHGGDADYYVGLALARLAKRCDIIFARTKYGKWCRSGVHNRPEFTKCKPKVVKSVDVWNDTELDNFIINLCCMTPHTHADIREEVKQHLSPNAFVTDDTLREMVKLSLARLARRDVLVYRKGEGWTSLDLF